MWSTVILVIHCYSRQSVSHGKLNTSNCRKRSYPVAFFLGTTTQLGALCSFVEQIVFPKRDVSVLHNYRSWVLCFRPRLTLSVNTQMYWKNSAHIKLLEQFRALLWESRWHRLHRVYKLSVLAPFFITCRYVSKSLIFRSWIIQVLFFPGDLCACENSSNSQIS